MGIWDRLATWGRGRGKVRVKVRLDGDLGPARNLGVLPAADFNGPLLPVDRLDHAAAEADHREAHLFGELGDDATSPVDQPRIRVDVSDQDDLGSYLELELLQ